jgi:hypothetical protein
MEAEYTLEPPHPAALLDIIKSNRTSSHLPEKLAGDIHLLNDPDQITNFKHDESEWYQNSWVNRSRCDILRHFSLFSSKQHTEMSSTTLFRSIISLPNIKILTSKQDHPNYSINESQPNLLISLQGYLLHNFLHLYLLADLKFLDRLDSLNIEYNNPYSRVRIRLFNSQSEAGSRYISKFCIQKFCLGLLGTFFPNVNGIWTDWFNFTHCVVLEIVRYC